MLQCVAACKNTVEKWASVPISLYICKRALHTYKRALYTCKRALYIHNTALYTHKRALYIHNTALYTCKYLQEHWRQVLQRPLQPKYSMREMCATSLTKWFRLPMTFCRANGTNSKRTIGGRVRRLSTGTSAADISDTHTYHIHITYISHTYHIHITYISHTYHIYITYTSHTYHIHTYHTHVTHITYISHTYHTHIIHISHTHISHTYHTHITCTSYTSHTYHTHITYTSYTYHTHIIYISHTSSAQDYAVLGLLLNPVVFFIST